MVQLHFFFLPLFPPSVEPPKEERPELQKKTYKWNTKEEAKQAFKELLKEKVSRPASQTGLTPTSSVKGCTPLESEGAASFAPLDIWLVTMKNRCW